MPWKSPNRKQSARKIDHDDPTVSLSFFHSTYLVASCFTILLCCIYDLLGIYRPCDTTLVSGHAFLMFVPYKRYLTVHQRYMGYTTRTRAHHDALLHSHKSTTCTGSRDARLSTGLIQGLWHISACLYKWLDNGLNTITDTLVSSYSTDDKTVITIRNFVHIMYKVLCEQKYCLELRL